MRKKPARMGRPPLPASERHEHRIDLRLRAAEYAALDARARAEDVTPTEWARRAVLRALHRRDKR